MRVVTFLAILHFAILKFLEILEIFENFRPKTRECEALARTRDRARNFFLFSSFFPLFYPIFVIFINCRDDDHHFLSLWPGF